MAARDVSPDSGVYRALLVPDERCGYAFHSAALSSGGGTGGALTQAGPRPGVPVAQRATFLAPEATGEMAAGGALRLLCNRGGMPGPMGVGLLWKYDGDDAYRGNDVPTIPTDCEPVDWSTTTDYIDPHIVSLDDGTVLIAAHRTSGTQAVVVWRRAPATGAWTSTVIFTGSITWTSGPTLVPLPSGRVLLFRWVEVGTDQAQIRMYFSDNSGSTFTEGARSCLRELVDTSVGTGYQLGRLRAAYAHNEILLMGEGILRTHGAVNTWDDSLGQWASLDLGASFTLVERGDSLIGSTGQQGKYVDVVAVDGVFVVAHIAPASALTIVRRLGSAFTPLSTVPHNSTALAAGMPAAAYYNAGDYFDEGGLALWSDDDGALYILTQAYTNSTTSPRLGYLLVTRSLDGGETWACMGQSSAGFSQVFASGEPGEVPWMWSACAHRGRTILAHGICPDIASTYDGSLVVAYLGGFSTITMPGYGDVALDTSRTSWEITYTLPWIAPNATAWASAFGGAPTLTITADAWRRMVTGVGESAYYSVNPTSTLGEGLISEAEFRITSGTGILGLRLDDGANRYEIEVQVKPGSIVLYDVSAAANVATVVTTVAQTAVRVFVGIENDNVYAVYRAVGSHGSDREWTEIGASTGLTAGATSGAGNRVRIGCGASTTVDFRAINATWGEWTGAQVSSAPDDEDRWPRSVGPTAVYIDGGTFLRAKTGPGFAGDSWHCDAVYTYGVEHAHIDVSPSPRRTWRSTQTATAEAIAWLWNSTLATREPFRNVSMFAAILGGNVRNVVIEGRDNAGAWVNIGEIDCAKGMSALHCTRQGRILIPDTGTAHAAAHYLLPNQLAGSHVRIAATDIRPILKNTEGAWRSTTTKRPTITLDGYDDTEPASGALEVWSKDALTIVHDASVYNAIRARIPAQDTYEGYFKGKIVIGHVFLLTRQDAWGGIRGYEHGTELFEQRGGTRSARRVKPMRRYAQLPWTELVSARGIQAASPEPHYVTAATGGSPAGVRGDTLWALAGLLEELGGPEKILGYLDYLPRAAGTSSDHQVADRARFMFGRITSTELQLGKDVGSEGEDEVNTSPGFVLTEEL